MRNGGTDISANINALTVWILLILGSVCDMARKKIPVLLLAAGGAAGVMAGIAGSWNGEAGIAGWISGCLPGACMVLLAFATREKIGYGDGILLMALGMLEGWSVLADLLAALFLAAVFGSALLVLRRGTLRTRIPFVPFLLAAHVLQRAIMG